MHLKALKIFCDVVYRRSFSRAADENSISQSGASQVVHQLERRLGVKLIDRSKRPFMLTPEGEVYYDGCRKLVERYDALEEEVRTLHEEVAGRVRVASIYSVGLHHMNRYLQEFLSQYPESECSARVSASAPRLRGRRKRSGRLGAGELSEVVAHDQGHPLARGADGAGLLPVASVCAARAGRAGGSRRANDDRLRQPN